MANIPRALSLAVFRVHIENGLSVAVGVGLTGLIVGWAWGFDAAVAAASGAVAVSLSDQPDPLSQKPWVLGFALLAACALQPQQVVTPAACPPAPVIPAHLLMSPRNLCLLEKTEIPERFQAEWSRRCRRPPETPSSSPN